MAIAHLGDVWGLRYARSMSMLTFDEIEQKYTTSPIRVCGPDDITGVLRIQRKDTSIDLVHPKFFHFESGENGWFDLEMVGPDGRCIYAHNALSTGTGSYTSSELSPAYFASIHPNALLFDSRGLNENRKIRKVMFRIRNLNYFFNYQYTESLDCFELSDEVKNSIQGIRYNPDMEKDFFAPAGAFLIHEMNSPIDFNVEGRRYEIFTGGVGSLGSYHGIKFDINTTAAIYFDDPVSIDDAMDRVWEWRRFFIQMAMQYLPYEGMWVQAQHDDRTPVASLYLPNTDRGDVAKKHYYEIHPAYLPLNRWNERAHFTAAMQKWIAKEHERRAFRARLDQVIKSMNRRTDQMDLIELAAGIDSLSELSSKLAFPDGSIDAMVDAAQRAAVASKLEISPDRLRGVLSQLPRPSLAEKMKELGRRAMPEADFADIELVVSTARKCRDDATHRGAVSEQLQHLVGPAVEALASMCVAFDLRDAGVPRRTGSDSSAFWAIRFRDAVQNLRYLKNG